MLKDSFFRLLCGFSLLALIACSSESPPLQDDATLTIRANPRTIKNAGDTSIITIRAVRPDQRPVFDGTPVTLDVDGGFIRDQVTLVDGQATAVYTSDLPLGTFTIEASSGELGVDGSVSVQITVEDGRIPVSNVTVDLSPNNLPLDPVTQQPIGGVVAITAVLTDDELRPLPNEPVIFSSDQGQLESNGIIIRTDGRGVATDLLRLRPLPIGTDSVTVTVQTQDVTTSRSISFSGNETPIPLFDFSPADILPLQQVNFDAGASTDPDGEIVRYDWRFGDGSEASSQVSAIAHRYEVAGTYTVRLTVTDNLGASQTTTGSITVGGNETPTAAFTVSPATLLAGEQVFFDASTSADVDGEIVGYRWDFGDGDFFPGLNSFSALPTTDHVYLSANKYTVTLTVIDDAGTEAVVNQEITVDGNIAPTAKLKFLPESPKPNEEVGFDAAESTDDDGTIVSYEWRFGDGTTQTTTGPLVSHTYSAAGTYQVFLTVIDNEGSPGFAATEVVVTANIPPIVEFSFAPTAPFVDDTIVFDATKSSDPDGFVETVTWSFSDGATATGFVVSHAFTSAGAFTATAIATDDFGSNTTAIQTVTVATNTSPVAVLALSTDTTTTTIAATGVDSTDAETALSGLTFGFSTVTGNTATLAQIPAANAWETSFLVTFTGDEAAFQTFVTMTVTDTESNSVQITESITYDPGTTTSVGGDGDGDSDGKRSLRAEPRVMNVAEGRVLVDARGLVNDAVHYDFGVLSSRPLKVDLIGAGPVREAVIRDGKPGDVLTFFVQARDVAGKMVSRRRQVQITDEASNHSPIAALRVSGQEGQDGVRRFVLDATGSHDVEDATRLAYRFTALGVPQDAVTIDVDPHNPARATATVRGVLKREPQFRVEVRDPEGLRDAMTRGR